MNEKKFLKKLNSKENLSGLFTYTYVFELLDESKKPTKKSGLFSMLLKKYSEEKSAVDIIYDNFDLIFDSTNTDYKVTLLNELMKEPKLLEMINFKLGDLLERLSIEKIDRRDAKSFFKSIYDSVDNKKEFIEKNYLSIINNMDLLNLVEIKDKVLGFSMKIDETLNNKFKENRFKLCEELIKEAVPYNEREKANVEDIDLEDYSKTIAYIIEELLNSEDKEWIDIDRIGGGSFSKVFRIGEKVLKIGIPRMTYDVPNHKRILQPIARTNLTSKKSMKVFSCVEVADYLERVNIPRNREGKELLYSIYKELRDNGINYTDIDFRNLGIKRTKNVPTLNGEEFNVNPKSVGFDKENEEDLEAGEILILDTDFLYGDDIASDEIVFGSELSVEFDKRYDRERKQLSSSNLTKKQIKALLREIEYNGISNEIAILITKYDLMSDEELKNMLEENKTIGKVQDKLIEELKELLVKTVLKREENKEKTGEK